MNALPWRVKIGIVVAGYVGVLGFAAVVVTLRYLTEKRNPADFNGGMAAGGDWILELFLVGLLLIPTFLLVFMIRNSEHAYTKFAKVLLGFGLTAPASAAIIAMPAIGQTNNLIGWCAMYRIFSFPMTFLGLVGCAVLAKFKRPRRLIFYSLVVETAAAVFFLVA